LTPGKVLVMPRISKIMSDIFSSHYNKYFLP
jgi:hypothetical protein